MTVRLKTDFRDYYDIPFYLGRKSGRVFERVATNSGPSKREQFALLDSAGYLTPPHGLVGDVYRSWWESEKSWVRAVVVYEDEMAHCGQGKRFANDATLHVTAPTMGRNSRAEREADRLWGLYCSAFCGNPYATFGSDRPSVSWRMLQFGPHRFWIEYSSAKSWMSNFDGECKLMSTELHAGFHPVIKKPLFAVDFVIGRELYAVDLNYAPGVGGSGVESVLSPDMAFDAISNWYEAHHEQVEGESDQVVPALGVQAERQQGRTEPV